MSVHSKVEKIVEALKKRIFSKEFEIHSKLPPFRKLATEYETTQETINKAIQTLQAEGLLVSMGSKGVFVNDERILMTGLTKDYFKYLQDTFDNPTEEYLEPPTIIKAPTKIAKIMKIPEDTLVVRRARRQGADSIFFRLEETFYLRKYFTQEALDGIMSDAGFDGVVAIKQHTGLTIEYANDSISIRLPNSDEQKLLKIVRTNPVVEINRRCYSDDKKTMIMFDRLILNANYFILSYDYPINHWK